MYMATKNFFNPAFNRATKNSKKPVNIFTYTKNVVKSAGYIGGQVIQGVNPELYGYIKDAKDFAKDSFDAIKGVGGTLTGKAEEMLGENWKESILSVPRNAFEDLKTGKFYNPERNDAVSKEMAADMGLDFNFDEDFITDFDEEDNKEGFEEKKTTNEDLANRIISGQYSAGITSASMITTNASRNTKASMQFTGKMFGQVTNSLAAISGSVMSLHQDLATPLNSHINNSLNFYQTATAELAKQTALLENITKLVGPKEQNSFERKRTAWEEVMGGGLPNLSALAKAVKKNVTGKIDSTGITVLLSMLDPEMAKQMVGGLGQSPIATVLSTLIGGKLKNGPVGKAVERTVDLLKAGATRTALKVHKYAKQNKGGILGTLASLFDIVPSGNAELSFDKYNKGRADWTGKDSKALREVIPLQLAKIISIMSGKPPKIYDYESGTWKDATTVSDEFSKKVSDAAVSGMGSAKEKLIDQIIADDVKVNDANREKIIAAYKALDTVKYDDKAVNKAEKRKKNKSSRNRTEVGIDDGTNGHSIFERKTISEMYNALINSEQGRQAIKDKGIKVDVADYTKNSRAMLSLSTTVDHIVNYLMTDNKNFSDFKDASELINYANRRGWFTKIGANGAPILDRKSTSLLIKRIYKGKKTGTLESLDSGMIQGKLARNRLLEEGDEMASMIYNGSGIIGAENETNNIFNRFVDEDKHSVFYYLRDINNRLGTIAENTQSIPVNLSNISSGGGNIVTAEADTNASTSNTKSRIINPNKMQIKSMVNAAVKASASNDYTELKKILKKIKLDPKDILNELSSDKDKDEKKKYIQSLKSELIPKLEKYYISKRKPSKEDRIQIANWDKATATVKDIIYTKTKDGKYDKKAIKELFKKSGISAGEFNAFWDDLMAKCAAAPAEYFVTLEENPEAYNILFDAVYAKEMDKKINELADPIARSYNRESFNPGAAEMRRAKALEKKMPNLNKLMEKYPDLFSNPDRIKEIPEFGDENDDLSDLSSLFAYNDSVNDRPAATDKDPEGRQVLSYEKSKRGTFEDVQERSVALNDTIRKNDPTNRANKEKNEKSSPASRIIDGFNKGLSDIIYGDIPETLREQYKNKGGLMGFLTDLPRLTIELFNKIKDKAKEKIKTWADKVKTSKFGETFKGELTGSLKSFGADLWDTAKNKGQTAWNKFQDFRKNELDTVTATVVPADEETDAEQAVNGGRYRVGHDGLLLGINGPIVSAGETVTVEPPEGESKEDYEKRKIKENAIGAIVKELCDVSPAKFVDGGQVKVSAGKPPKPNLLKKAGDAIQKIVPQNKESKTKSSGESSGSEESSDGDGGDSDGESSTPENATQDGKTKFKEDLNKIGNKVKDTVTEVGDKVLSHLLGDSYKKKDDGKSTTKTVGKFLKENLPQTLAHGVIGAVAGGALTGSGLGLLGGLAVGAGTYIINNSTAISQKLFGEFDQNTNEYSGGVFSRKTANFLKKRLPSMVKSGALGAITGAIGIVPGGILGGLAVGAGVELLSSSDAFQNFMFGPPDKDGKRNGGLMEQVKSSIFGHKGIDGKRRGGILGSLKVHALDPFLAFTKNGLVNLKDFFVNEVFKPIGGIVKSSVDWVNGRFRKTINGIFENLSDKVRGTLGEKLDPVIKKVSGIVGGVGKAGLGLAKNVISKPFQYIDQKFKKHNIKAGYSSMTPEERMKFEEQYRSDILRDNRLINFIRGTKLGQWVDGLKDKVDGLFDNIKKQTKKFFKTARHWLFTWLIKKPLGFFGRLIKNRIEKSPLGGLLRTAKKGFKDWKEQTKAKIDQTIENGRRRAAQKKINSAYTRYAAGYVYDPATRQYVKETDENGKELSQDELNQRIVNSNKYLNKNFIKDQEKAARQNLSDTIVASLENGGVGDSRTVAEIRNVFNEAAVRGGKKDKDGNIINPDYTSVKNKVQQLLDAGKINKSTAEYFLGNADQGTTGKIDELQNQVIEYRTQDNKFQEEREKFLKESGFDKLDPDELKKIRIQAGLDVEKLGLDDRRKMEEEAFKAKKEGDRNNLLEQQKDENPLDAERNQKLDDSNKMADESLKESKEHTNLLRNISDKLDDIVSGKGSAENKDQSTSQQNESKPETGTETSNNDSEQKEEKPETTADIVENLDKGSSFGDAANSKNARRKVRGKGKYQGQQGKINTNGAITDDKGNVIVTGSNGEVVKLRPTSNGSLEPDVVHDRGTRDAVEEENRTDAIQKAQQEFYESANSGGLVKGLRGLITGEVDEREGSTGLLGILKNLGTSLLSGIGTIAPAIIAAIAAAKLGSASAGTSKDSGMYKGADAEARKEEVSKYGILKKASLGVDALENTIRGRDTTTYEKDDFVTEYETSRVGNRLGKNLILSTFNPKYGATATKVLSNTVGKIPIVGKTVSGTLNSTTKLGSWMGSKIGNTKLAKAASNKITKKASSIATKAANTKVGKLVSATSSKISSLTTKAAGTKAGKLITGVASKIKGVISRIFNLLMEKLGVKGAGELAEQAARETAEQIAERGGTKLAKGLGKTIGMAISGVFIANAFLEGIQAAKAKTILGILDTPTFPQRLLAGAMNALNESIPLIGGIIPTETLFGIVYTIFQKIGINLGGDKFAEQRAAAKATVEAYNSENGTTYNIEEYIHNVLNEYTIQERVTKGVKNFFGNLFGKKEETDKTTEKETDAVGSGSSLTSNIDSNVTKLNSGKYSGTVDTIGAGSSIQKYKTIMLNDATNLANANKNAKSNIDSIVSSSDSTGSGTKLQNDIIGGSSNLFKLWKSNNVFGGASNEATAGGKASPASTLFNKVSSTFGAISASIPDVSGMISTLWKMSDPENSMTEYDKVVESYKTLDLESSPMASFNNAIVSAVGGTMKVINTVIRPFRYIASLVGGQMNDVAAAVAAAMTNGDSSTNNKGWFSNALDRVKSWASDAWSWATGNKSSSSDSATTTTEEAGSGSAHTTQKGNYTKFGRTTIDANGCGPAVASTILKTYGKNIGINKAAKYAESRNYVAGASNLGTKASYFADILGKNGISTAYTDKQTNIRKSIKAGKPTILLGQDKNNRSKANSPFGPNPHYVVARGTDRKGNVIVDDPELNRTTTYNKSILNKAKLGIATGGDSGLVGSVGSLISGIFGTGLKYVFNGLTGTAAKLLKLIFGIEDDSEDNGITETSGTTTATIAESTIPTNNNGKASMFNTMASEPTYVSASTNNMATEQNAKNKIATTYMGLYNTPYMQRRFDANSEVDANNRGQYKSSPIKIFAVSPSIHVDQNKSYDNGTLSTIAWNDTLPNCVGWATARFNHIYYLLSGETPPSYEDYQAMIGEKGFPNAMDYSAETYNNKARTHEDWPLVKYSFKGAGNASGFCDWARKHGLTVGFVPHPGAIMCWGGSYGHVAVVEQVISNLEVLTSESNYDNKRFANVTRTNSDGRWGSDKQFLGFIYNPAVEASIKKSHAVDTKLQKLLYYNATNIEERTRVIPSEVFTCGIRSLKFVAAYAFSRLEHLKYADIDSLKLQQNLSKKSISAKLHGDYKAGDVDPNELIATDTSGFVYWVYYSATLQNIGQSIKEQLNDSTKAGTLLSINGNIKQSMFESYLQIGDIIYIAENSTVFAYIYIGSGQIIGMGKSTELGPVIRELSTYLKSPYVIKGVKRVINADGTYINPDVSQVNDVEGTQSLSDIDTAVGDFANQTSVLEESGIINSEAASKSKKRIPSSITTLTASQLSKTVTRKQIIKDAEDIIATGVTERNSPFLYKTVMEGNNRDRDRETNIRNGKGESLITLYPNLKEEYPDLYAKYVSESSSISSANRSSIIKIGSGSGLNNLSSHNSSITKYTGVPHKDYSAGDSGLMDGLNEFSNANDVRESNNRDNRPSFTATHNVESALRKIDFTKPEEIARVKSYIANGKYNEAALSLKGGASGTTTNAQDSATNISSTVNNIADLTRVILYLKSIAKNTAYNASIPGILEVVKESVEVLSKMNTGNASDKSSEAQRHENTLKAADIGRAAVVSNTASEDWENEIDSELKMMMAKLNAISRSM